MMGIVHIHGKQPGPVVGFGTADVFYGTVYAPGCLVVLLRGLIRFAESLLVATAIALGVGAALMAPRLLFGV